MRKRRAAALALEDLVEDLATLADQARGELERAWWTRLDDTFRRIEALAKSGPGSVLRALEERDAAHLKRASKGSRRGRRRASTAAGKMRVIVPAAANHPAGRFAVGERFSTTRSGGKEVQR